MIEVIGKNGKSWIVDDIKKSRGESAVCFVIGSINIPFIANYYVKTNGWDTYGDINWEEVMEIQTGIETTIRKKEFLNNYYHPKCIIFYTNFKVGSPSYQIFKRIVAEIEQYVRDNDIFSIQFIITAQPERSRL